MRVQSQSPFLPFTSNNLPLWNSDTICVFVERGSALQSPRRKTRRVEFLWVFPWSGRMFDRDDWDIWRARMANISCDKLRSQSERIRTQSLFSREFCFWNSWSKRPFTTYWRLATVAAPLALFWSWKVITPGHNILVGNDNAFFTDSLRLWKHSWDISLFSSSKFVRDIQMDNPHHLISWINTCRVDVAGPV